MNNPSNAAEKSRTKLQNKLKQIHYSHKHGFLPQEKYDRVKTSLEKKKLLNPTPTINGS